MTYKDEQLQAAVRLTVGHAQLLHLDKTEPTAQEHEIPTKAGLQSLRAGSPQAHPTFLSFLLK